MPCSNGPHPQAPGTLHLHIYTAPLHVNIYTAPQGHPLTAAALNDKKTPLTADLFELTTARSNTHVYFSSNNSAATSQYEVSPALAYRHSTTTFKTQQQGRDAIQNPELL